MTKIKPKHTAICLRMETDYLENLTLKARAAGISTQAFIMNCIDERTGLVDQVQRRGPLAAPPGLQPPQYMHVDEKWDGGLLTTEDGKVDWFTHGWVYKVPEDFALVIDLQSPLLDRVMDLQHLLQDHPDAELVYMNVDVEKQ